jgi:type IV secretory pathway protease TraF
MPVKEVLALPGDCVRFTPQGIYRNGQLIPHTAPEPGIPRCPFSDIAVPRYFFVGDGTLDPDSWGSRYMCFIPQGIIEGTVTRVW